MVYSDTYYIERTLSGDTESFAPLIERYGDRVFSLTVGIVRSREEAEELAQDVFVKAFRNLRGFRGQSSFATWLYRIAYNTAVSASRRRRMEFPLSDEAFVGRADEGCLQEEGELRLQRLENALSELSADERAVVFLFYMEERSVEEVAAMTGLSRANVKTRLHRTRRKLHELMGEEDDNE